MSGRMGGVASAGEGVYFERWLKRNGQGCGRRMAGELSQIVPWRSLKENVLNGAIYCRVIFISFFCKGGLYSIYNSDSSCMSSV